MREVRLMCEFGDVFSITSGNAFKKSEYSGNGVRLFQIANVSFNKTSWDKVAYLPESYLYDQKYQHLILHEGDIVMALNRPMLDMKLKVSQLSPSDVPSILYQRVGKFNIQEHTTPEYLLYYLQSPVFIKWLADELQGVNIPFINQSKLLAFDKFPINSIPEQRAIVAKIEELFSDLDKGVADLKKAQDQLKVYRQAVLKKAFEGEFTKEWREQQTKNEEWESLTFNDVLEIISGKNQKHVEDPNGKYPIYGSGGIFGKSNQYLCEAGTTIIGRKGTINSPIYVNERFWNVDTAFGLSPSGKISSLFLFYFCLGFNFKRLDKSTTIPSLAKRDLLKIHINIPPQEEQHHIVQEIESRLSVCDKVEESITGSLEKAEVLRQSILKKAFEGNLLLTQEIEKCKTAPDYEPAAVLLEKIKMKQ